MDQETITLTWPSGEALLAELRQLGGNVDPRRFAGLRTPRWRSRLAEALEARAGPGRAPATHDGGGLRPRVPRRAAAARGRRNGRWRWTTCAP